MGTASLPLYSIGQNSHKTHADLRGAGIEPHFLMECISNNWPHLHFGIWHCSPQMTWCLVPWFSIDLWLFSSLLQWCLLSPLLAQPLPSALSILVCPQWPYLLWWLQSPPWGWWSQISKDGYSTLLTHVAKQPLQHLWKVSEQSLCPHIRRQSHDFRPKRGWVFLVWPSWESPASVQLHHTHGHLQEWPPWMT